MNEKFMVLTDDELVNVSGGVALQMDGGGFGASLSDGKWFGLLNW